MKTFKSIQKKVMRLLIEKPTLRDDDIKLVSNIWYEQISRTRDIKKMSAFDLLLAMNERELIDYDSITRARRKIQKEDETLRGENYNKRKSFQKNMIKDIYS